MNFLFIMVASNLYLLQNIANEYYYLGVSRKETEVKIRELEKHNQIKVRKIKEFNSEWSRKIEKIMRYIYRPKLIIINEQEWYDLSQIQVKSFLDYCEDFEKNYISSIYDGDEWYEVEKEKTKIALGY